MHTITVDKDLRRGLPARLRTKFGVPALVMPKGWKIEVPGVVVRPEDRMRLVAHFIEHGLSAVDAERETAAAVQMVFMNGWCRGAQQSVMVRAVRFAELWSDRCTPVHGELRLCCFDPGRMAKMYVPYRAYGRGGNWRIEQEFKEMVHGCSHDQS